MLLHEGSLQLSEKSNIRRSSLFRVLQKGSCLTTLPCLLDMLWPDCTTLTPPPPFSPAKDPIDHTVLLTTLADMVRTHPEDKVLRWLADQLLLTPEDLQQRDQFCSGLQVRTPAACPVLLKSAGQYDTIIDLTSRLLYVCCFPC